MKKKIVILIICIVLFVLALIPQRGQMKDGGTVHYFAVLYQVSKIHSFDLDKPDGFKDGTIVKILGIEVYNDVEE